MVSHRIVKTIESILIFALGLGMFVSKPVIYSAAGCLVALALVRLIVDTTYRKQLFSTWLSSACLGLFLLGLVATLIHPGTTDEIAWTARKLLYLPLLPVLYVAFMDQPERLSGLTGVFVGFWVAAFLTMQSIGWQWGGGRVAGATWLMDVWGVLTGLFVSFLIPRLFESTKSVQLRLLTAITAAAATVMLVLSGARGPLLGLAVSGFIYLLLYQRKTLIVVVTLTIAGYLPAKQWLPYQVNYLEDRIASITQTASPDADPENFNASNWVRLQLWQISIAQDLHKLEHSPLTLLFGSGPNNQINEMRAFFTRWDGMTQQNKELLESYGYPSNEVHNMYLDATGKMGVLWTLSSLLLIAAVVIKSLRMQEQCNQTQLAVLIVSTNFLVTGITYDILPHWGTFFLVFFTMLAIHADKPSLSQSSRKQI